MAEKRKRLIVFGGLGFIGSRLVELALETMDVLVLDAVTYAGSTSNLSPALLRFWRKCDLNDTVFVEHMLREFRPDYVANLAAETHVTRSIDSQQAFVQTNVTGTTTLARCCLDYWQERRKTDGDFRLLQASTDEVYGSLRAGEEPWVESCSLAPNNPYAASKAASELLAMAFHRTYGLPVLVTRGCNVFGPRQHPEKALPTFLRQLLSGRPVTLHGDGLHEREWMHVDDHCFGLLTVLRSGKPGNAYNLAGGVRLASRELAREAAAALDLAVSKVDYIADRLNNDRCYASWADKAAFLGWFNRRELFEQQLRETASWYVSAYERRYQDGYGR
jgi:dTDP-glucose 4,6-dehydratase